MYTAILRQMILAGCALFILRTDHAFLYNYGIVKGKEYLKKN